MKHACAPAVSAGHRSHADSCDFVPAGLPGVVTVAAADITHDATSATPWSWSNFGQCVDIWAPGVNIESASPDCFECTAVYSGTSQATPLVSGLVAAFLSTNPTADPEAVKLGLQKVAAVNVLDVLGHPYDTTVNYFAQVHSRILKVLSGKGLAGACCDHHDRCTALLCVAASWFRRLLTSCCAVRKKPSMAVLRCSSAVLKWTCCWRPG